ncbi:MAG: YncE family protein [Acetobacteraceae bacterium]
MVGTRRLPQLLGAAALVTVFSVAAQAKPFMIVGLDQKVSWNSQGQTVLGPSGNDKVLIVDLATPSAPKIVASLPLENSVVGPPVNVAISPNGDIAIVADSVTLSSGTPQKLVPTDKLFVIDLKADPPKLLATLKVGEEPSGLSINPAGDLALVANRAGKSLSVLKISGTDVTVVGTVPMGTEVSAVTFTPDGKRALTVESQANKVALLAVNGETVTPAHRGFPTYWFPYNVMVTPNGQLAFTADNGDHGISDGNADAISVIDLADQPPRVIDHIGVPDAPEGLAISPRGDLLAVASVQGSNSGDVWFHHADGVVTIFRIAGMKVTPEETIKVGRMPEPLAFSPSGKYLYVGNYLDDDFSILRVDGTDVVDTGKILKVPGQPASASTGAN